MRKKKDMKYPRYFVHVGAKTDPRIWMSYCYVKEKGGKINYIKKENVIDRVRKFLTNERFAEKKVESGSWRDITRAELALIQ